MAIQFDGSTGYISIPNFPLPAAPWCMVVWYQKPSNAGADISYLFNSGALGNNRIEAYVYNSSNASTGRRDRIRGVIDNNGASTAFLTPDASDPVMAADSQWRVLVIQHVSAASWEAWICPQNGTATLFATSTTNVGGVTTADAFNIGRVTNGTKYWNGTLAEFSFSPTYLTQAEIEAIAAGNDIDSTEVRATPIAPTIYLPLLDNSATQDDQSSGGTYDGTVNGTLTTVAHPYETGETATLVSRPVALVSNTGWFPSDPIVVSSITRSSTTATCSTATPHGRTTGEYVQIRGADQAEYNGTVQVTVTDSDTFTYTVSGSPATPATGTIYCDILYDMIDDDPVDDASYIRCQGNGSLRVQMAPLLDPGTTQEVSIYLRAQKVAT